MGQSYTPPVQQQTPVQDANTTGASARDYGSNQDRPTTAAPGTAGAWDQARAQQFLNLCGEANTLIDQSYALAQARANHVAVAYATAWNRHKGALEAASARQQLVASLILTGALTFAGGFAGTFIGPMMTKLAVSQPVIDGTTDLVKWGITTAGTSVAAPASRPLQAFPTDPLAWQNMTEARMLEEKAGAYDVLRWWQGRVNAQDIAFNLNFDPRAALAGRLKVGGTAMTALPAIDIEAQANAFEEGFWAEWCKNYGYSVTVGMGGYYYADERVPKEGEERLLALLGSEEAAEAFIVQYGAQSRAAAEEQAHELNSLPIPRGPLY